MASTITKVVVLTSTEETDDPIAEFCSVKKYDFFRGSLSDVLKRYWDAVEHFKLKNIIRVTADCPLIEPSILDCVNIGGISNNYDYFYLGGAFPDGLDCVFISRKALSDAHLNARLNSEREHVGPYIEKNINLYKSGMLELFFNHLDCRLTLDTSEDLNFLSKVLVSIESAAKNEFNILQILGFLQKNPHLQDINCGLIRNSGYETSVKNDWVVDNY